MPEEIDDKTTETLDTEVIVADADDSAGKEVSDNLTGLLDDHGFDSVEDLRDAIEYANSIKSELGDDDLKVLKERNKTLTSYEKHWKKEEARKKEEEEEPEDTIKRYKKELKERDEADYKSNQAKKESADAKAAIKNFDITVKSVLDKEASDMPAEERKFLEEYVGINNPSNIVNIDSKADVAKMAKAGISAYKKLEQSIIKRYRDGKLEIPKITSTDESSAEEKKKAPKTFKDAGKVLKELLKAGSK